MRVHVDPIQKRMYGHYSNVLCTLWLEWLLSFLLLQLTPLLSSQPSAQNMFVIYDCAR